MKKILALIMALALVCCLFAGCGSSSTSTASTATDTAADPAADTAADTAADEAEDEAPTDEAAETYSIGIVQLVQHDALDAASQGFMDALTELLGEENVTFDYLNASGESTNCTTIVDGFVAAGVDLIMANATAALQAAVSATSTIPVLGTSITDYASALDIDDWTGTVGGNVSGTSDLAPLDQQADMINELFPDAETVGLLYCSAEPNSVYQCTVIEGYLQDYGYEVEWYSFTDTNDLTSVTQAACDSCDVIYVPTDNTAANNTEAIANVVLAAGVPVVAGEEGICSGCGVATLSISYYDIGYITGEMAYEILANGGDVSTMAIEYAPQVTKEYNASNCEFLGIEVPADYTAIGE
ncbi:MAG: ABC transporter substrate-binding protein [Oscillospiraceae bacterium]|nr:ABC transporter substrate-binding protein [Oscillospiraceae bacterium]